MFKLKINIIKDRLMMEDCHQFEISSAAKEIDSEERDTILY